MHANLIQLGRKMRKSTNANARHNKTKIILKKTLVTIREFKIRKIWATKFDTWLLHRNCEEKLCFIFPTFVHLNFAFEIIEQTSYSVTRFLEISPLWHNFKSLGQCFETLFSIWQNFNHTLAKMLCYWTFFFLVDVQIFLTNLAIWSHCRAS